MSVGNLFLIGFSIICSIFLVRWFLHRTALIYAVRKWFEWVGDRVHVHQHFKVPELNDSTQQQNLFYRRVSLYLSSLPSLEDSDFTNLFTGEKPNDIVLSLDDNQAVHDVFLGARISWLNQVERDHRNQIVSRSFVLRIKKKDKRRILKPYLQHIHTVSDEIEQRGRELKIHNNCDGRWKSVRFNHPADFDSLVLDPDLKTKIRHDMETFVKSKQYYHKLGRVWKRSYLLYGPSGTGKSSFIAAAANLLNYDVYYVSLAQVADEADLTSLLLQTTSKSLTVVEDLDRYVAERSNARITSSGLLNFMDGLLNAQDERIMIFTMNSKDGIDSALLRPGRIDMHIHFPNCDFNSFKNLANNYLGVKEHKLFPQVEEIFQSGATMSPAEISELMMVNRSSPSRALKSVISALQSNGKSGGKVATRLSDSSASSPAPPSISEEGGGAAWKETMPKEFRKLYGLLRLKSCKRPGSFDHDESETIQR
ncbi:P-loop containing nucleoside triphosphate hydrolases superfamily protein [Perilla frutescens var. hirtella]|nr:P-loop containing nucleoside triphosphate hydrolases superfamily protein [Perilla frutescens var. hirtella]KAH6812024.1 P-loop containing nucleoside triphosphate hydrolases superfamily protein [Perilla frutescens var. frutescens]